MAVLATGMADLLEGGPARRELDPIPFALAAPRNMIAPRLEIQMGFSAHPKTCMSF
jgi:hypothetical protein